MQSNIEPSLEYLAMHRDKFLTHMNTKMNTTFDKATVGAAILRITKAEPQILVLKRRDDERYYPGVFEIPGGKVDATDATVGDAVMREVAEEANLMVTSVVHPLSVITYTTTKPTADTKKKDETITHHAIQLSYVVTVKDSTKFKVNEEEHSTGMWINRGMLKDLSITDEMRGLLLEALGWGENNHYHSEVDQA
ncbi:MutT family protein [Phlyctema vagabunda]|uniref:MutT family protein n=1 Tax=Phlyctema vagabunda TaxID=108571 RepID=A0ABR4P432_9HELO